MLQMLTSGENTTLRSWLTCLSLEQCLFCRSCQQLLSYKQIVNTPLNWVSSNDVFKVKCSCRYPRCILLLFKHSLTQVNAHLPLWAWVIPLTLLCTFTPCSSHHKSLSWNLCKQKIYYLVVAAVPGISGFEDNIWSFSLEWEVREDRLIQGFHFDNSLLYHILCVWSNLACVLCIAYWVSLSHHH